MGGADGVGGPLPLAAIDGDWLEIAWLVRPRPVDDPTLFALEAVHLRDMKKEVRCGDVM